MKHRVVDSRVARTAVIVLVAVPTIIAAQAPATRREQAAANSRKLPRTPDGKPDLQGNWSNATVTPFERPAELGDKAFFSKEEAAAFERQRLETLNVDRPGGPRDLERSAYNSLFAEPGKAV